jgi:hypothetical protein
MANAMSQASKAAQAGNARQAAQASDAAADALAKAAQAAAQSAGMPSGQPGQGRGKGQGKPGGKPGSAQRGGGAGPMDSSGVPPELKKLGITADDWARLPSKLRSQILQASEQRSPDEYRDLVKQYFRELAKQGSGIGENKP